MPTSSLIRNFVNFAEIDEGLDGNPEVAYEKLKKIYDNEKEMRTNVDLLWRIGKACFLCANSLPNKNPKKKLLIFEGRAYVTSACAHDENNFEVIRWAAILTGSAINFLGPKEKIEQGKIFKTYLDRALEMQRDEFTLLHLRGRFMYEIACLSWIEKKLCNVLFSDVPCGTIDEALADFLQAEKHVPFVWPENLLFIARCYYLKKNKKLAEKYLEKVEMIEGPDEATMEALAEVRIMVAKLK